MKLIDLREMAEQELRRGRQRARAKVVAEMNEFRRYCLKRNIRMIAKRLGKVHEHEVVIIFITDLHWHRNYFKAWYRLWFNQYDLTAEKAQILAYCLEELGIAVSLSSRYITVHTAL